MSSDCFSAKSVVQVKNLKKKVKRKIAELKEWDALPQRANKNIFFFLDPRDRLRRKGATALSQWNSLQIELERM